jgi:hypothetical protein
MRILDQVFLFPLADFGKIVLTGSGIHKSSIRARTNEITRPTTTKIRRR